MAPEDDDRKVKDMIGSASLADLQRWFGLPSFTELEEEGKQAAIPEEDPYKEARERRERALAAVAPWFLTALGERAEKPWSLVKFKPIIDVHVRLDMAMVDIDRAEAFHGVAEPREIERPEVIEDQLKERTPQALLRDLHRVESFFEKSYEVYDAEVAESVNVVAIVEKEMATDHRLPPLGEPPAAEFKRLSAEVRAERTLPWADLPKRNRLVNRRVDE